MRYLVACAVVLGLGGYSFADTWTVDDDGPADFNNIQAAVDASSDGDEIVVEPGTYQGSGDQVVNLGTKSLTLRSASSSTVTVISGSGQRKGIFVPGSDEQAVVIEGFTVSNCTLGVGVTWAAIEFSTCTFKDNLTGMSLSSAHGSSLDNCIFRDNHMDGTGAGGTGLRLSSSSSSLTNCLFESNNATYGGGMQVWDADPTLTACTFDENSVYGQYANGGAIYINQYSSVTLVNCWIGNSPTGCGLGCPAAVGAVYTLSGTVLCDNLPFNIGGGKVVDLGGNLDVPDCEDLDEDGIPDPKDNCPIHNPEQTDCNGNSIGDVCDLVDGTSEDVDGSGVPDECECLPDVDMSGTVDVSDLLTVIAQWHNAGPLGDVNYDGIVNVMDLLEVISSWGPCE